MAKYRVEEMFEALGQGRRRAMVEELSAHGRLSLTRLAAAQKISLPGALKHMRILERAGVVESWKEGRVSYYRLNYEVLNEMTDWLLYQQRFWSTSFDRLEKHINSTRKKK